MSSTRSQSGDCPVIVDVVSDALIRKLPRSKSKEPASLRWDWPVSLSHTKKSRALKARPEVFNPVVHRRSAAPGSHIAERLSIGVPAESWDILSSETICGYQRKRLSPIHTASNAIPLHSLQQTDPPALLFVRARERQETSVAFCVSRKARNHKGLTLDGNCTRRQPRP